MRIAVCILLAAACGAPKGPARVRAWSDGAAVQVQWQDGTGPFRVQAVNLENGESVGAPVESAGSSARLPLLAAGAGVRVTASDGRTALGFVSGGASGGSGEGWQIFAPQDFRDGGLHVSFASLGAGERLGVLVLNEGGKDLAEARVEVSGVQAEAAERAPGGAGRELSAALRQDPAVSLHEAVRGLQEQAARETAGLKPGPAVAAAAEAAGSPTHRAFCVVQGLDFAHHVRKPATRLAETVHAEFFVDDEDAGDPAFVTSLAGAFEERVLPSSNAAFGAPTDVDQNGKVLVLMTHELGTHLNGGWLIGYFGNGDLLRARDNSPDCSENGSNHGEIIYLNALSNGVANGYSARDLAQTTFPATLAHELQHLVNLGRRCVEHACAGPEETWINEALSKLAEDLAGYGWNAAQGRAEGALYLSRSTGDEVRGYEGRSLTKWEGDPIGNYQGAHSFLRFFADRRPGLASQLVDGPGGNAALADALGQPLPRAMAEWATALLLSNEAGAPFSFSGEAWSPLHERLRHLEYRRPGETALLRTDGLAAFVSGAGGGGPAEVLVRIREALPPHVAVVRIHGALPLR